MEKVRILLLQPKPYSCASLDQSWGTRLASKRGPISHEVLLEEDSFQKGDLQDLERTFLRWSGKVSGVVGATSVPESTRLGELVEEASLLCFVSNNDPVVRGARRFIFHIGIPTRLTSKAVSRELLKMGLKRLYLLYDETNFQKRVAMTTAAELKAGGAEVRLKASADHDWLEDVMAWKPEALYMVYSEESRALPRAQALQRAVPNLVLLLGRSLLRRSFLKALGSVAEGVLVVDMFRRGSPRSQNEAMFLKVFAESGVDLPTSNHGFGWDALILCTIALRAAKGDATDAVEHLESGVEIEAATGPYRFSKEDHNGRGIFDPTILSRVRRGQVEPCQLTPQTPSTPSNDSVA